LITYSQACLDPHFFGPWFSGESWTNWRVIDKALFGEPLDADELAIFRELTGRQEPPDEATGEAWFIIGRRGGKDVKAASLAAYLATVGAEAYGWRKKLTRGERGVVQLLAVDKSQAGVAFAYASAMFDQPMLKKLIRKVTADSIELKNGLAVEITTNDQRRVRGRTVVAAVFDEVAHWRNENTVNPDEDVFQAVRPSMATMPGAMLIGISSPYARKGLLWRKYRENYGKPGKVLVVKAPTWRMNPTVPRDGEIIREAYESDPQSAAAEYGAEFRSDIESLLTLEAVQACVDIGTYERPPVQGQYVAFVDPSGGSSDSMTLAIGHKQPGKGQLAVLDVLREAKPPFDPEAVVAEFAGVLKSYGIRFVYGDRFGGEWVKSAFRKAGMGYLSDPVPPKSQLYLDLVPLVNARQCLLLDHSRLERQLVDLERRTGRGTGRDVIDHPPGGHDDVANAVAGVFAAIGFHDRATVQERKRPEWEEKGYVDMSKITYSDFHEILRRTKRAGADRI